MKKEIMSYSDYQEKIRDLKTPEEVARFAQELFAPVLKNLEQNRQREAVLF